MPEAVAGSEILNLRQDFPPVPTADVGSRHRQRPEGRRLRKEAGLAHRGRARRTALLPQGGARRAGRPAAHRAGPLPVRARSGPGLGDRAERQAGSQGHPRRPAARSRRARGSGTGLRDRRGRGAAGGADRHRCRWRRSRRRSSLSSRSGPSYFIEIAKLRAARMLWAQAVAAFGPADDGACRMRLHVRTPRRNKSAYDRYTNLLRVTTEALSAVVGGCDQLTVEPFGFDAHLALNVQRILQGRIAPRRGGRSGGRFLLHRGADRFAGARSLEAVPADGGRRRLRQGAGLGLDRQGAGGNPRGAREGRIPRGGARWWASTTIPTWRRRRRRPKSRRRSRRAPLPQVRVAEPFEKIRRRTTEHARATGRYPEGAAAQARRRQDEGRALQLLLQFLRLRGLRHGGSGRVSRARTRT